jgi:hypothetical protein
MNRKDYWAAVPSDQLADKVQEKVDAYYKACERTGKMSLWRKVYRTIYGMDKWGRHTAAFVERDGEQGELVTVKIGHVRNLSNHLVNLTVQQRLSYDCRAKDTSTEATTQTERGSQWLDWQVREKGVGQTLRRGVKIATDFTEAFVVTDWDESAGDPFSTRPQTLGPAAPTPAPLEGAVAAGPQLPAGLGQESLEYTGETYTGAFYPDDVARELYEDEDGQSPWHVVSRWENVHKLAAKYPEYAEQILQEHDTQRSDQSILPSQYLEALNESTDDRTRVFYLYHRKCPQLPYGRRAVVIGKLVVKDGHLWRQGSKIRTYPVHRMAPENQGKTCFGYSSTIDLLAICDLIDMLYSAGATNLNANAVNNYWMPPNNGVSVTQLAGALNLIESAVKPEVLDHQLVSPELVNFIKMLETLVEIISGVNSVARGNPDGALKGASGSALALLQSMTIQFASGLQEGYGLLAESVGQALVEIFQEFGERERDADLVGKDEKRLGASRIKGADIAKVSKVAVDLGNPATRTFAGRKQIADEMMANSQFKRPHQYLMFLATGRFEHLTESETSQLKLVKAEGEHLKAGKPALAMITDDHSLHVLEHQALLDSPEVRLDPQLSTRIMQHLMEHVNLAPQVPPVLAQLLGRQPIMPPQPQMGPGGPGGPGGAGGPPPQQAPGPAPEQPVPGAGDMPAMPTNPLTNEQVPAPAPAA